MDVTSIADLSTVSAYLTGLAAAQRRLVAVLPEYDVATMAIRRVHVLTFPADACPPLFPDDVVLLDVAERLVGRIKEYGTPNRPAEAGGAD